MNESEAVMPVEKVAAMLEATPAALRALVSGFDEEALSWHPGDGEWCAKEVIGHLIEMDRLAFAERIVNILAAYVWPQMSPTMRRALSDGG